MNLKVWFLETRPQFLVLTPVLIFLGTCFAWYEGFFDIIHCVLAFVGLLLLHISVNVLNDYHDYKSGIDLNAKRTPFSGGSGILPANQLQPKAVRRLGLICFLLAVPIGIYFVLETSWLLLPLLIIGAICVLLYTTHITKLGWVEWAPGLGMGMLPVLGAWFVQSSVYPLAIVFAAIPSGILVHNLLLINEFPDVENDLKGGRRTMPIAFGKATASKVFSALTIIVYLWIIAGVAMGIMPVFTLIALLTIPFAVKAINGALHYQQEDKLIAAMGSNVQVVMLTQLLLGIGYLLAGIF